MTATTFVRSTHQILGLPLFVQSLAQGTGLSGPTFTQAQAFYDNKADFNHRYLLEDVSHPHTTLTALLRQAASSET